MGVIDFDKPKDIDQVADTSGNFVGQQKEISTPSSLTPFNDEKSRHLHQQLLEWWTQAHEIQSVNRYQQAIDDDFYDGLQWDAEDAKVLEERGQAPLVYNRIKPSVDWVLGTEKRTRVDFNVLPRKKEQNKEAEAKKERMKYADDVNKTAYNRSRAFKDSVVVGVGWLEDAIRGDDTDLPLVDRYESWRNMWYDPLSVERDLSDSRFIFRSKFLDYDIALAMFPNAQFVLDQAVSALMGTGNEQDAEDDFYYASRFQQRDSEGNVLHRRSYANTALVFNRRKRVKLIECWYRKPITEKRIRGGEFNGQLYDSGNEVHKAQLQEEYATLTDSLVMKMHCAILTESHILQNLESPYDHNDFPFTPIWCYRRSRDNAPYGIVRNLRDPQESLNKRSSKALHILSTTQIIADEDAATDWDEIREEAARPDGMMLLDGRHGARFELNTDKQLAQQHINLMEEDARMIQDVSGVTDENLGRDTNATSGKAITARQEQGSVITAEIFDNLRYATQLQGEKRLALIEQFDIGETDLRILGRKGVTNYLPINKPVFDEQSGTWTYLNPMTANKADYVVDEQDYHASMRQAMMDSMLEMIKTLPPEIGIQLLDLVYDNSDLPGRDEIVSRIRQINGQTDPNDEDNPETAAKKAAQEQQKAEQDALQQQLQQLEVSLKKAMVDKTKAQSVSENIKALYEAMQAGQIVATVPGVAPIADSISQSAGFIDQNGAPIAQAPVQALPSPTIPPLNGTTPGIGVQHGIETMRNDGAFTQQ